MNMRVWLRESNINDWDADLYSLTTALVFVSLAECVYFNPYNKWFPSTHFVLWGIMLNLCVWSAHHLPIFSDVLAARVVVLWEKLVFSSTLILLWHIPFLSVLNGYSWSLPQYGLAVSRPVSSYLPWIYQHTPTVCSANSPSSFLTLDPVLYVTFLGVPICSLSALHSARVTIWRWAAQFTFLSSFLIIRATWQGVVSQYFKPSVICWLRAGWPI